MFHLLFRRRDSREDIVLGEHPRVGSLPITECLPASVRSLTLETETSGNHCRSSYPSPGGSSFENLCSSRPRLRWPLITGGFGVWLLRPYQPQSHLGASPEFESAPLSVLSKEDPNPCVDEMVNRRVDCCPFQSCDLMNPVDASLLHHRGTAFGAGLGRASIASTSTGLPTVILFIAAPPSPLSSGG